MTTDSIVPRWEWRTFGSGFGAAEVRIRQAASQSRASHETYLLCGQSDANVKIRDGLLDIKTLQHVNTDGLEQWAPVLKSPFPLSASDVSAVFTIWQLPVPTAPVSWTLEHFLDAVVASPAVTVVDVAKQRSQGVFERCLVEAAELRIDGETLQTLAVEQEDPTQVLRVVRTLGLAGRDNVNYVKALKRSVRTRSAPVRPGRALV